MTGYSAIHLALAAFCAVMMGVHLALWWALRIERTLLWMATAYGGFCAMALGIAGSSLGARHSLGSPGPWLFLAMAAAIPCFVGVYRSCWSFLDCPDTAARRAVERISLVIAFVHVLAVTWALARPGHFIPSWEEVMVRPEWPTGLALSVTTIALGPIWLLEAIGALRRGNPAGAPILAGGVLATVVTASCTFTALASKSLVPTWFAALGPSFVIVASIAVVQRFIRMTRFMRDQAMSGYRMQRRLGSGGMGDLYLAARVGPGGFQRHVALKRLNAQSTALGRDAIERFLAEARLAARLSHPNIVAVHDIGQLADGWFIAMEYVAGLSLAQVLRKAWARGAEIPVAVAVTVIEAACRGLAHAHAAGVIHRDIKPDNVMLAFDGTVKLIDFGIAKDTNSLPDAGAPALATPASPDTQAGLVAGTHGYLAPERLRGEPASARSDVFSMGVVLRNLLTGTLSSSSAEGPGATAALPQTLPALLTHVVSKALNENPQDRLATAQELGESLDRIARDLPIVDRGAWMRSTFAIEWNEQQALLDFRGLRIPTPTEELPLAPAGAHKSELPTRRARNNR